MSMEALLRFCALYGYIYIEDYAVNGVLGRRFLIGDDERKWYADIEIERMLR